MTDIIARNISRTLTFVKSQIDLKEKSFQSVLRNLAQEFGQEDGPSFESSSSTTQWRDLKATLGAYREIDNALSYVSDSERDSKLRQVLDLFESEHALAKTLFKRACKDLTFEFGRNSGPWGPSSSEADWVFQRARARVYGDVLNMLSDAKEALGAAKVEV